MIKKLNPRSLRVAENRLASIKSIAETIDFGNGVTVDSFENLIGSFRDKINDYNSVKSMLDGKRAELFNLERELLDKNESMLLSVAVKYGKDSTEYAKAGGIRKSNRRRSGTSTPVPVVVSNPQTS